MANCCEEQPSPESFQEIEEGGFESGTIHGFQMPYSNSTPSADPHHHHQFTAAYTYPCPSDVRFETLLRCTSCGGIKKRSGPSKRAALHDPATTNAAVRSDTALKSTSSDTNGNVLNRSVSDITSYMGTQETGERNANQALDSQLGENSKINSVSRSQSPAVGTLPPLPPVLHRSISEPVSSYYQPVADSTPSRVPSTSRTSVPSPGSDKGSPDSRRLRRIKERVKQMNQWVQKVVSEEEMNEETCTENENTRDKNSQKMSENKQETRPNEEAVWAEESGENIIVHIKCPCGRRFEIFLSGKKCYYRLV